MGRKKKSVEEEVPKEDSSAKAYEDEDSSDEELQHFDIDPEIRELCHTYKIDESLTQKLNDIMIGKRQKTWEQDIKRLYDILKDAHTPAAMLNLKVRDMEKGKFVGKANCGPRVQELAKKHRLDQGARTKLEEAMSMREGMGKDVEKDLQMLDEHLQASNAPSKLVSMKLDSLRKGFSLGHCVYSREPLPGNSGPGVDGVFDKKSKRTLGYSDADLDRRFAEQAFGSAGGKLMDEATVRRLMAAERKKVESGADENAEKHSRKDKEKEKGKQKKRSRSRSRCSSRGRERRRRSRSGKKEKASPPPRKSVGSRRSKRRRSKSRERKASSGSSSDSSQPDKKTKKRRRNNSSSSSSGDSHKGKKKPSTKGDKKRSSSSGSSSSGKGRRSVSVKKKKKRK